MELRLGTVGTKVGGVTGLEETEAEGGVDVILIPIGPVMAVTEEELLAEASEALGEKRFA